MEQLEHPDITYAPRTVPNWTERDDYDIAEITPEEYGEICKKRRKPMFNKFVCSAPYCPTMDSGNDKRCKCHDPAVFGACPLGKKEMQWTLIKEENHAE